MFEFEFYVNSIKDEIISPDGESGRAIELTPRSQESEDKKLWWIFKNCTTLEFTTTDEDYGKKFKLGDTVIVSLNLKEKE